MNGYLLFSLKDMLSELGESKVKSELSSFSCPLNKDVEYFLRYKSIEFSRQNIAPTHLVYASYKGNMALCGYFTVANKEFNISSKYVSNSVFKRLKKFGTYDAEYKCCNIPAPLIAQLGKNFTDDYNNLITGDELLDLACREVKRAQTIIGGKTVYIECEDKPKLIDFYERNGFISFGKRNLDKDERDKMDGQYLIQMIKYLKEK